MAKTDQLAASNAFPPKQFNGLSQGLWNAKKDSIFRANQRRVADIFENIGFPGFDIVGVRGSSHFWAIVQHSDFDPEFQKKVLEAMLLEVQNQNASNSLYAMLTDRVKINTGKNQIYGTQVDYNFFTGKAYSINTVDPENLNKRREEVGLQPIEEYLKDMTKTNLDMTPTIFGLTMPTILLILVIIVLAFIVFIVKKKKIKNR